MRLSKKGAEKVSRNCHNVRVLGTDDFFPPIRLKGADKIEFDQEDFTGVVCLTAEEAKEIFWLLVGCWREEEVCMEKERRLNDKWQELLPNLIKQAEGKE